MNPTSRSQVIPPSAAVVEEVAAREGVDSMELEPLYGSIDPDALDELVGYRSRANPDLRVTFSYHGHEVCVTGEGAVHVDADARPS